MVLILPLVVAGNLEPCWVNHNILVASVVVNPAILLGLFLCTIGHPCC